MWAEEKDWEHFTKSITEGKFELNNMDASLQVEVGKEKEKGKKITTLSRKFKGRPQISVVSVRSQTWFSWKLTHRKK